MLQKSLGMFGGPYGVLNWADGKCVLFRAQVFLLRGVSE